MADLLINTSRFNGDDDLKIVGWLKENLSAKGYDCDPEIAKNGGFYGFFVRGLPARIWVYAANVGDEPPQYQWGITVEPKLSFFARFSGQNRDAAHTIANEVMAHIKSACEKDPEIEIEEEYDPLTAS